MLISLLLASLAAEPSVSSFAQPIESSSTKPIDSVSELDSEVSDAVAVDLSAYAVPPELVLGTLSRTSLDPGSVAAVDLSLNDAIALLTRAAAALDQVDDQLSAADEACGAARVAVDSLERSIRAGQAGDPQAATAALATARANEASARSVCDAILAGIIAASIEPLSNSQKAALASIRSSAPSWRGVPAGYRVAAHDEASLLSLRNALAAKRIAIKHDQPVPADATAVLQQWLADQATAAAVSAQEANAAMIDAAWATATSTPGGE